MQENPHPKPLPFDDTTELGRMLSSALQPEFMPKHRKGFQKFKFSEPVIPPGKKKAIVRLGTTDNMNSGLQIILDGGESVLHAHAAATGFWMVIKGRARFFDEEGVAHEINPLEGIVVPRGTKYAFEKASEEPLYILQVESLYPARRNTYVSYGKEGEAPQSLETKQKKIQLYDGRVVPPPEEPRQRPNITK